MHADPLSDILAAFDTRASVSGGFSAGGRWSIRFPAPATIKFGAVVHGNCWLQLEDQTEPLPLSSGDVFIVNGRSAIRLYTDVTIDPVEATHAFANETDSTVALGQGDQFQLLGGHLALDLVGTALLSDVLPPVILVAAESDQAANLLGLLERLVTEMASARPGSAAISQPLAHLLFVHVLRDHIESGTLANGWLKALGDRRIAPAIGLMHAQPAKNWHLAELAAAVGMSRSNFAERFKVVSGMSPLSYLRFWRMRLAEKALQAGAQSLASLSASLGYASESAFSTAFKQAMGVSPAQYRAKAQINGSLGSA